MYAYNVLVGCARLVRRPMKAYNVIHEKTLFSKLDPGRAAFV
jgi:hypothetical protein